MDNIIKNQQIPLNSQEIVLFSLFDTSFNSVKKNSRSDFYNILPEFNVD